MGVGHPGRKEAVAGYVLHDFGKADEAWLDDMLRGISDGAAALAEGDAAQFQNAVARRLAPPRPAAGTTEAAARTAAATGETEPRTAAEEPRPEARSALQRLVDRFR
jgi:PTH1 family peptidyl-tRNA hydrolase